MLNNIFGDINKDVDKLKEHVQFWTLSFVKPQMKQVDVQVIIIQLVVVWIKMIWLEIANIIENIWEGTADIIL